VETTHPLTRVAFVSPEPTPYRAPLLDLVAERPEIDLTVIYAARTVAGRTWTVEPAHRAVFLDGASVPGARRVLHHDYPVTPGIFRALRTARPELVVVSGWSTFAAQAAVAWCRLRRVPYLLLVESHDYGPKSGWRRGVKGTAVPRIVRGAAGVLVVGSLARESVVSHGADPARVRVFANTVDVGALAVRANELAARRPELRWALGLVEADLAVLTVARLAPEKGHDTLLRAVAAAGEARLCTVLVGDGPERGRLQALASALGVRAVFAGDLAGDQVTEAYVAGDVFCLLSEREPWAVVVNEAAACGLPLLLSERVGAAHDLLRDGENGVLVPAGDVDAAARALRELAADPERRRAFGARSREIVSEWGYESSVEALVAAVREAIAAR
jgi:glycosyltransferase involved in cell wall biosynthesis